MTTPLLKEFRLQKPATRHDLPESHYCVVCIWQTDLGDLRELVPDLQGHVIFDSVNHAQIVLRAQLIDAAVVHPRNTCIYRIATVVL